MRKRGKAIAAILFTAVAGSAATITSFTATPDKSNNFTTDTINSTFTSNTANITNSTVICNNIIITGPSTGCTGVVADFEAKGSDLNSPTPFSVTIDGTYALLSTIGTTSAVDQLSGAIDLTINGLVSKHYTFAASPSTTPFSETIASENVPGIPGGVFDIVGTVTLSMPNGSELVLPSSISLAIGATPTVPEPGAMLLMGAGLSIIGLAGWRKRRGR